MKPEIIDRFNPYTHSALCSLPWLTAPAKTALLAQLQNKYAHAATVDETTPARSI